MKNFKFIILLFSLSLFFCFFCLSFSQAVTHTLEDYGLTEETVKYLSEEEIQSILNSKTPAEILAEKREEIKKNGTEEELNAFDNPKPVNPGPPNGTVNCFDYYQFGSIQTNLIAQGFTFNAGDTINFSGPIINNNGYPIVSGTLYVKIFRQRSTIKEANGPDVVDQFIAVDNIVIPALGKTSASFSWTVPSSTISGRYTIASFFIVDKKFNLLGLSFTDDVIGNTFDFNIKGEKNNVQFDKSNTLINDKPYFFAAYPPRISVSDSVVISAKIDNETNSKETVGITWKLYKWDSINPNNLINTFSELIDIEAKSSKNIQTIISETEEPVYYLVGELTYDGSKSIINIRFIRPEVDKTRLNFPSITSFPIKNGVSNTLFSCLHNSGTSQNVPDGKLILEITDINGKTIEKHVYEGLVTGEMMATKKDFVSKKNLDHFFLTAQLWQSNKLVDESKLEYDCNIINSGLCNKENNFYIWIIVGIILLVLLLVLVVFIIKKRKK